MKDKPSKKQTTDDEQDDTVLSSGKRDAAKAKEHWTKEEMERAKPIPFPEKVDDAPKQDDSPKSKDDDR